MEIKTMNEKWKDLLEYKDQIKKWVDSRNITDFGEGELVKIDRDKEVLMFKIFGTVYEHLCDIEDGELKLKD